MKIHKIAILLFVLIVLSSCQFIPDTIEEQIETPFAEPEPILTQSPTYTTAPQPSFTAVIQSTVAPTEAAPTEQTDTQAYYVDAATGSDFGAGTIEDPWRSIQHAADQAIFGDTIVVLEGQYSERVQVKTSGSEEFPITFRAEGNVVMRGFTIQADFIVVDGFAITDTANNYKNGPGIYVEGEGCVLENNYIYYTTRGGILLHADPGKEFLTIGCVVRNNRLFQNSQYGIDVRGQNHLIEGNEIWGSIQYHPKWINPPSWVDADGIRFFGSGHVFRGNYIHDISLDQEENLTPHIDAFQTWDQEDRLAARDCLFEKNVIELGFLATGFQLEGGTKNLIIQNNIIKAFTGVLAYPSEEIGYTVPENLTIIHNIFMGELSYPPERYPVGVTLEHAVGSVVLNNIFLDQPDVPIRLDDGSALTIGYNLFYNTGGVPPAGSPSGTDLWQIDPLFVDLEQSDFHLLPDSPLIDMGTTQTQLDEDFDGVSRPQGAGFDIGPFEYQP